MEKQDLIMKMFNDATGFKRIFLKVGYTDLRKGIPGLTAMIRESFGCDPYEKMSFSYSAAAGLTG